MRKSESGQERVDSSNIDVNGIITKVRGLSKVSKEGMSAEGKPMVVNVEGFNFSVGKLQGECDFSYYA